MTARHPLSNRRNHITQKFRIARLMCVPPQRWRLTRRLAFRICVPKGTTGIHSTNRPPTTPVLVPVDGPQPQPYQRSYH